MKNVHKKLIAKKTQQIQLKKTKKPTSCHYIKMVHIRPIRVGIRLIDKQLNTCLIIVDCDHRIWAWKFHI